MSNSKSKAMVEEVKLNCAERKEALDEGNKAEDILQS